MRRSIRFGVALLLGLGFWVAWMAQNSQDSDNLDSDGLAIVEYVIDGDTVELLLGNQPERVRLIGIDTPETVSRSTPVQCFGSEASAALLGLLPPGTQVRIARDEEARDRYGRLLLYVYRVSDDLFVNEWLVAEGFADAVSYPPNDTFAKSFASLRDQAQHDRRGLWGACDGPDQPLQ